MIKFIRDFHHFPQKTIWMIGNFDGIHLGHQSLIEYARDLREKFSLPIALLTFEPHPRRFFKPDLEIFRLLSWGSKLKWLDRYGVDYCYAYRFNEEFSNLTADKFASEFLPQTLNARHIVIGDDFHFGANRLGNGEMLVEYGRQHNYETHILKPKLSDDDIRCSSSNIRQYLRSGDVEGAEALLGRPYSVTSHVRRGHQYARKLGFPTANIAPNLVIYPKNGVYSGFAVIDGQKMPAIANVGIKPTIFDDPPLLKPLIEVHILDKDIDLYGKKIEFYFTNRLRDEMKFPSLQNLQEQIKSDIQRVKENG